MNPLNNSWIKLPRTFTSWRWYHDSKMVHVFLYFLLQANVKKTDYLSLTVYPGQVVTSLVLRRIRAYPQEISVLAFKSYHKPVISRFTQAIKEPL